MRSLFEEYDFKKGMMLGPVAEDVKAFKAFRNLGINVKGPDSADEALAMLMIRYKNIRFRNKWFQYDNDSLI